MRKFYLLLVVALLATSSAFADITYVLNGGQPNPYGWNSKDDMYDAFMTDAGVTDYVTIAKYQEKMVVDAISGEITTDGLHSPGICVQLKEANAKQAFAMTEKWGWLETYIKQVYENGSAPEGKNKSYRADYAAGAFFLCSQSLTFPAGPSFVEAGKDEAYLPAWEYCYAFPTSVTEPTTLKNPWKENCTFAGWYTTADFSGNPVTTIDANTTGTLHAKWINNVFYELNGGAWNPYGWTSKDDMFKAFMQVALEKTEVTALSSYKASGTDAAVTAIAGSLYDKDGTRINRGLSDSKFGWLKTYVMTFQNAQKAAGYDASELMETITDSHAAYRFAVAAFFAEGKYSSYPKTADFKEAGKDEAYFKAWGYSYGNPSIIEGEYKLKNPYREGAWEFAGWYDNAEFDGEPTTTINADFAGTLYAKWNPIIKYELNGGSYGLNNPYGWTSKSDMFNAFMAASGTTLTYKTLDTYCSQEQAKAGEGTSALAGRFWDSSGANAFIKNALTDPRFTWLATYIKDIEKLEKSVSEIPNEYKFAVSAFFVSGVSTHGTYPSSDYSENGKDENYCTATAWGHSYDLKSNPKEAVEGYTLNSPEKEGCTFQGWYDNRWFTGDAVTTLSATTTGTLYAHWSSIMGSENTTLNTLHTHYFDGTYVYASTIGNKGSNKNLYNSNKAGEYFSDNNPKGDRKDITLVQEDWVAISGLTAEDVYKEIEAGTAFTKGDNTTFPVINITTANAKAASARELNNYRVANFNIYADNAHVNNIWLVAPQAGEYCHLTGYVKAVSGDVVTLAASDKEDDAVEMTVNIAKLSAKSAVVAGAWYKFTGIVVNGVKALTFNATSSEDVSTGVEEAEIGSTIVRGMNGEIAVSVASPATVNVYTAGGALVATRNIADSDAIAVAPGFYVVKTDNTVVKVLVK